MDPELGQRKPRAAQVGTTARVTRLLRFPAFAWSNLSIRTRLVLVATVPQLVYTNVMTWLGNQTLHQAVARMDARLVAFPPLRSALHEIYSEGRLLLYVTISLFVGLVSAAGATLMANQLRKKLDHLREAAGRIAQGDLHAAVGVRGRGEIGLIGEALEEVREKLRSRIDLGIANTQLQQDLALARAVESMFLPRTSGVEHHAFALAAFHRLAPRCSGDIWHHHIEQDGTLWVMLGDVAGTGPGPAMIAGALVTAYRIRVDRGELSSSADLLEGLHRTVLATAKDRHPVALSLLSLTKEGALTWWNAGTSHLLIRRKDGAVEILSCSAPALGEAPQRVHRQALTLAPREVALAFTSGVLGALDAPIRHLQELLAGTRDAEVADTRDQLGRAIEFGAAASHQEDVTLIVLGRKRGEA